MNERAPQINDIDDLVADARERIAKVTTLDELKAVQLELLGKKAPLAALRQSVGGLEPEARKVVGQALNAAARG
jgi:phenylalanyl-tRNA synthetase alpha subunit